MEFRLERENADLAGHSAMHRNGSVAGDGYRATGNGDRLSLGVENRFALTCGQHTFTGAHERSIASVLNVALQILNGKKTLAFESQIQWISRGRHLALENIDLIAAEHAIVVHGGVQLGAERIGPADSSLKILALRESRWYSVLARLSATASSACCRASNPVKAA